MKQAGDGEGASAAAKAPMASSREISDRARSACVDRVRGLAAEYEGGDDECDRRAASALNDAAELLEKLTDEELQRGGEKYAKRQSDK